VSTGGGNKASDELVQYSDMLKERVRAWMRSHDPKLRQVDLAKALDVQQGTVSSNLSSDRIISEAFVARLQEVFPDEFGGVLDEYLRIKHAAHLSPEKRKEVLSRAERRRQQLELIRRLKELLDELAAALTKDD